MYIIYYLVFISYLGSIGLCLLYYAHKSLKKVFSRQDNDVLTNSSMGNESKGLENLTKKIDMMVKVVKA